MKELVRVALMTVGACAMVAGAGALTAMILKDTPAVSEDSPGWDCLRQGNVTCRIDGVLVTSIDDLPTDPYDRCVYLLGISERVGGIGYDSSMCERIEEER